MEGRVCRYDGGTGSGKGCALARAIMDSGSCCNVQKIFGVADGWR